MIALNVSEIVIKSTSDDGNRTVTFTVLVDTHGNRTVTFENAGYGSRLKMDVGIFEVDVNIENKVEMG